MNTWQQYQKLMKVMWIIDWDLKLIYRLRKLHKMAHSLRDKKTNLYSDLYQEYKKEYQNKPL